MKNIVKSILVLLLLGSMQLEAQDTSSTVRLEKGEKKFKNLNAYTLKEYHFVWNISYLDLINFFTKASDGKSFALEPDVIFYRNLKLGKASKVLSKKSELWLAKAIMKKEYFWKDIVPATTMYSFTSLRFMEKGDNRYKAVTELKDISDMLGSIDTMAEWQLWFYVTRSEYGVTQAYSYKKVGKLHRIRFASVNAFSCDYHEYFNYYNDYGKLVKTKKLKEYAVKECAPAVL